MQTEAYGLMCGCALSKRANAVGIATPLTAKAPDFNHFLKRMTYEKVVYF